jgi:hypothetical protein
MIFQLLLDFLTFLCKPYSRRKELVMDLKEWAKLSVDIEPGSIVSALTKKVNGSRVFRRVGPSTFEILDVSKKTP